MNEKTLQFEEYRKAKENFAKLHEKEKEIMSENTLSAQIKSKKE